MFKNHFRGMEMSMKCEFLIFIRYSLISCQLEVKITIGPQNVDFLKINKLRGMLFCIISVLLLFYK